MRGERSGRAEFRRGWPVVAMAALGSGLGISSLFTYNIGLFVPDLSQEIGLTRGQFGMAFFAATIAMAVALPVVGKIVDRHGARRPTVIGSTMLVVGFLFLGSVTQSVLSYFVLTAALGLFAVGSAPISYMRAVSVTFDRARGLALGLTQMGIGVSAALVPPVIAAVIAGSGWRWGYYALAGFAALGLVPALIGLRGRSAMPVPSGPEGPPLLSLPLFRHQLAAFVVMALAFAGFLPHFVPMLRDAGLSSSQAAAFAALIGIFVILSRIAIGWLADHVHAPWVAGAVCLLAAGGCLALLFGGAPLAPVAAAAFGCAMGAEADLVGFLTSRYFGTAVFGRAYALQYAGFMLAAGASPAWIGLLFDRTGSYAAALIVTSGLLGIAAILFVLMPRYQLSERPKDGDILSVQEEGSLP
ncbi:major Facilitator Superfamily protein [Sphingobium sp. RAC03]|nr:major Facilitator Superfamily protein [Sphingobium sp. RAC03]